MTEYGIGGHVPLAAVETNEAFALSEEVIMIVCTETYGTFNHNSIAI